MNIEQLKNIMISASLKAGEQIMHIYQKSANFGIESKSDNSPLTLADKAAHQIISENLLETSFPILSEEGKAIDYETRQAWDTFWLIDPLDGTKEFIKKNGEFTTNIALIKNGNPVMGAVYAPVLQELYIGGSLLGEAFIQKRNNPPVPLRQKSPNREVKTVVTSRSHLNMATENYLKSLGKVETKAIGSSLKFMLIAKGDAEIYPRFGPTMEWDTAAADAIVSFLGYNLYKVDDDFQKLTYNKKNLLNPEFICQ